MSAQEDRSPRPAGTVTEITGDTNIGNPISCLTGRRGIQLDNSRDLLGRFLRERRARITLEQAGLPARRTRRTSTLPQEDLARITGYSIRTISALEQSADHLPTQELLEAIASALLLTSDDRRLLAFFLPDGYTDPAEGAPRASADRSYLTR